MEPMQKPCTHNRTDDMAHVHTVLASANNKHEEQFHGLTAASKRPVSATKGKYQTHGDNNHFSKFLANHGKGLVGCYSVLLIYHSFKFGSAFSHGAIRHPGS